MLDKLNLKFGSIPGHPPLSLNLAPVTIFIGPNNGGKSLALRELKSYCSSKKTQAHIINDVSFTPHKKDEFENELKRLEKKTRKVGVDEYITIDTITSQKEFNKQVLINYALKPNLSSGINHYVEFISSRTLFLDGKTRLDLLKEETAGDFLQSPQNKLAKLFHDDELRMRVSNIVYDAFLKYFLVDPTKSGYLRIRLSASQIPQELEHTFKKEAIDFFKKAIAINEYSDGVKAFVGIVVTMVSANPNITIIDEPEAFLHPSLSFKLGKIMASETKHPMQRLFVSTHSAHFLMGCIQSGIPLNIIRLTYNYNSPTARLLPKEKIIPLMRNPMLRSTGVLEGLFYDTVVVTEGDSDRAFYQEINERLLARNDPRGLTNCLFLNAQNKQTIWDIVKPLRELGIPALGIVDIDILKEGGTVWNKPMDGAFIPTPLHSAFQNMRHTAFMEFQKTGGDMKRDGGVKLLHGAEKESVESIFNQLQEYGIFVIHNGELESWLKPLGAQGEKTKWLIDIFQKMGEIPDNNDYIHPSDGDVWDFIGKINVWVKNPSRKGMPQ